MPKLDDLSNVFIQTLEQVIDGVVVINSHNEVILFNRAAEALWGYHRNEVVGQSVEILVSDILQFRTKKFSDNAFTTYINKIVGSQTEVEITRKDGSVFWGAFSISKVEVDDKILYTAIIKDTTELVRQRQQIELLSMVADKSDKAIFVTDENWKIIYTNNGFNEKLGYASQDVIGKEAQTFLPLVRCDDKHAQEKLTILKNGSLTIDELIKTSQGLRLWFSVTANAVFNDKRRMRNVVVIMSEMTRTKLHEIIHSRLHEKMARDEPLEEVMDAACREVNHIAPNVYLSIFKITEQKRLQLLAAPNLPDGYKRAFDGISIQDEFGASATCAYRGERVDVNNIETDPLWYNIKDIMQPYGLAGAASIPLKNRQGETVGVLTFIRKEGVFDGHLENSLLEILQPLCNLALEREVDKRNIRTLAFYDSLTSLPNRNLFLARAEQALAAATANDIPLAVLFLDLDRFKQVNDTFGHPAGDKLLQTVAQRLESKCGNAHICGRMSGDEFLAVITGLDEERLTHFVEDLRTTLSQMYDFNGKAISPSASIGISMFPHDGHDVGTLLHRADLAMYQAKSSGCGRFAFFSHELNQLAQEKQELEQALRSAIAEKRLTVSYQPQIKMDDGSIYGVEALSRWSHPKFGNVSPATFIPLAEEYGLIHDLSEWLLIEVCEQLALWREKGLVIPCVSINLSPLSFHNRNLPARLTSELNKHGHSPSSLTVELTEGVLLDTNPVTLKVLEEIHESGIGLAIDDFGTGYSSLSYLQKIPIKEIKLDKSFVTEVDTDATSRALSQAVIQIGQSLNLDVVAEGIEEPKQLAALKAQGYHVGQGFLFSKPLLPNEIESWMAENNERLKK